MRNLGLNLVVFVGIGLTSRAQHHGLRWAIDIGIHHANSGALGRQGKRQIRSRGALAHAPFARGHCNHVFNAIKPLHGARHRTGLDLDRYIHLYLAIGGNARQSTADTVLPNAGLPLRGVGQNNVDRKAAVFHGNLTHHLCAHQILARGRTQPRIKDGRKN